MNHPSSLPYLYHQTSSDQYIGVIPDILKELIETNQLDIRFVTNSRKRSEEAMYEGEVDLILLSIEWLRQPERLIATIPIHAHRSFIYGIEKFDDKFSLSKLKQQYICTKDSYSYPNLEPYFSKGILIRLDSSSHVTMLRMLYKRRCDYVIFNEYNALSLMKSPEFKAHKLYHEKRPISEVPLNIILRPELTKEKEILDKHIQKLIISGELQRLINYHSRTSTIHYNE